MRTAVPTIGPLVLALVLAPAAMAQETVWVGSDAAGVDLGLVSVSAGADGVFWDVDPSRGAAPPPPPESPPPMWRSQGHEHTEEPEPAAAEEAPPAAEEEPAPPLLPNPVSRLVPVPVTGEGPVPRVDLAKITGTASRLVPLLPEVAPAPGPAPARAPAATAAAEDAAPVAPPAAGGSAFVVGAAAVAAAASVAPAASSTLWRLRRLGLLALLYSRIAKERLLDHGSRERLLETVRAHAGATIADLATATGLPRNTVTYHLRVLERERLVSSTRQGRHRLYFAPGSLERRVEAGRLVALRHETTRTVAEAIARSPGLDQKALCEVTGISPSLAHWHARRLVEAGAVDSRREGRSVRYYPVGA